MSNLDEFDIKSLNSIEKILDNFLYSEHNISGLSRVFIE